MIIPKHIQNPGRKGCWRAAKSLLIFATISPCVDLVISVPVVGGWQGGRFGRPRHGRCKQNHFKHLKGNFESCTWTLLAPEADLMDFEYGSVALWVETVGIRRILFIDWDHILTSSGAGEQTQGASTVSEASLAKPCEWTREWRSNGPLLYVLISCAFYPMCIEIKFRVYVDCSSRV